MSRFFTRFLFSMLVAAVWASSYAQNISISPLTTGVEPSPLANNATSVAILGIQFDKAGGGTNSITALTIVLDQNPIGRFTNPRLVRSDNNDGYDAADLLNEVGSPSFGASSINFTGGITTFSGSSGAQTRRFFVVVDIDNSVNSSTPAVTPSLTQANVTASGTVNAGSVTGTAYSFSDVVVPTFTFNPLNSAINVAINSNIVITFDENVFQANGAAIDAAAIEGGIVELKITNDAGAAVPFTATFNGTNQITIDPDADLSNNTTYYVELNPVEDGDGNETTQSIITFSTPDTIAPTVSFNITNGATGVLETTQIIITFNEPVRDIDDSGITVGELNTLVELKLTDNAGAAVPFTATLTGGNTIITVTPTGNLAGNTLYYVEMNPVEDASNNATTATSITFTTGDSLPPQVTFNPANGATNVSAVSNIVLTFNEPIRKLDNSAITPADIQGGLVELKLTNNGGADVPFTASINGTNTVITINPNGTLVHNQVYYVEMNPIEDGVENVSTAQSITFTTEDRPSISGFLPAAGTCIADNVTVNGSRFTGTGSPTSGNTQPTVTVNGVTIPAINIVSFTSNQVVFTLPAGFATGAITVRNNDSDLVSANSSNLNVFPAINTGLTVTPATFSPAQNTNVNIDVLSTQDNNYNYALILTNAPGGYSLSPPATVHTLAGNSGTRTLNTSEGPDPNLDVIGDYTYRIDVSRTGCTTRTLSNTPFTLTVASLAVNVSTTNAPTNAVCSGSPITLIGATSGGTGFYQFRWSSIPVGYNSTSSSPTVSPTANIRYVLEVEDNAGNIVTDFVDVIVNPVPTADIIPAPGESSVRKSYVLENRLYQVFGSPSGGTFSGPGISTNGSGGWFFNPQTAGVSNNHNIVYTYTDANGCSDQDIEIFEVAPIAINGLGVSYCQNINTVSGVSPIISLPNGMLSSTLQFTRLVFYREAVSPPYSYCFAETVPIYPSCGLPNPLTVTSTQSVNDIQLLLPVSIPLTYTIDLNVIRTHYGTSNNYRFYIFVYGKNFLGAESIYSLQPFDVLQNEAAPFIKGINENENICADNVPILLESSVATYSVSGFSISGGFSSALSGSDNEMFNPGNSSLNGADQRSLTITMAYNDTRNCPSTVTRNFNWIKKPNLPIAPDVEFCQLTGGLAGSFKISGAPSGSADKPLWYEATAPTVILDSTNWDFIATGVTGLVPVNKTFLVRQQFKGCRSDATSVDIEIKPAPNAFFPNPSVCAGRPFTVTGPLNSSNDPYEEYTWDFGDGNSQTILDNNITTHTYEGTINRTIVLTVLNTEGCTNQSQQTTSINPNPEPDFSYIKVCEKDLTELTTTSNVTVTDLEWNFGDGDFLVKNSANTSAPDGGTYENPFHQFDNPGTYTVTLTSFTAAGCSNPVTKQISILDTLIRTSANPYIMTNDDGGMGYWRLEDVNGNSTWAFGLPTAAKSKMSEFTTSVWATGLSTKYNPNERSYLNSPCFNISAVERPVISMNFVLDTDLNREGVVLEYSKDGGVTWFPLGGTNSGINWFNTSGFGIGNIGSSPIGWSGGSWTLEDNTEADTLTEARRALDNLNNLNQGERANVRFRFAFATDGFDEYEGFAFNNFSISSRDRISLVENFTNNSSTRYGDNNTVFTNTIPNTEVAKIQYHVGFPDTDSEYEVNTVDPLARAAYYGIPMTDQQIPRSYIDGISDGPLDPNNNGIPNLANWAATRFSKQSLKTSDFDVSVESLDASDNSYFKIRAVVTAKTDIGAAKRPVLHLAVVEKTVDNNRFVLRKLVPNAVGHALPTGMNEDDFIEVIDSVRIEKPQIDVTELALVAFIQDVNTREVFQADLDLNPQFLPDQPTLVTAIEDLAEHITIYPNPANESFEIELPVKADHRIAVNLIDPVGRSAQQLYFEKGEQTKTVNTQNLAQGIYVVQIGSGKTGVVRKKVMVVH
ncbi:MAG TPA: Ig-like domain-containing protein [Cyclobacteriaceae bacterium]|nr:Ig-like domain-containing protein [Cyclobacteriaceae bacterium]HRF32088.1 Ig-like domain-containing protein [Cyclobacteriaceae bacterium]